jgi:hypothetical protein
MDTLFAAFEAEQNALNDSQAARQGALNKRVRDALQAERQKLDAEKRALDSQRQAFKAQQDKWAAEVEKEKGARMVDVVERERALAAKVTGFERQVREAEERYREPSNIVQLNVRWCSGCCCVAHPPALQVGGSKFETLRDTLTKVSVLHTCCAAVCQATLQVEGSMLQAMFSGRHPITKDKKGRAFLDRDADTFKLVLNYLRTDRAPEGLDKTRQMMFEDELR